jgi:hypothetical protein
MKTFRTTLLLVTAAALFGGASPAQAEDAVCSGLIQGTTITGNVTVPANGSCTLDTVKITGDVNVLQNARAAHTGSAARPAVGRPW